MEQNRKLKNEDTKRVVEKNGVTLQDNKNEKKNRKAERCWKLR